MLSSILRFSLRRSFFVLLCAAVLFAAALLELSHAEYDVFPEFAPAEVSVQTEAPGLTSAQVEALVTRPVEQALSGATGVTSLRSTSIQGLSSVQILFAQGCDIQRDRQIVSERLSALGRSFPGAVAAPTLTPLTSTTNNVMGVALTSTQLDLTQLRSLADWQIRPRLRSVPGVAEVEPFGGLIRQIQVQVHPDALQRYGLSFSDVVAATQRAAGLRGAGVIDTPNQRIALRADVTHLSFEQLAKTPLVRGSGETLDLAISLGDVATVSAAAQTPFSAAAIDGKPGILLMVTSQYGANTLAVTQGIESALRDLAPLFEANGVIAGADVIRPASYIEKSLASIRSSLAWGALLVVVVLFLFLHNWRAALICALSIPLSLAVSAGLLQWWGYSLNTMVLGGLSIAVGLVVDDAVIDVENMLRRLRERSMDGAPAIARFERLRTLLAAALEVRAPVVFATFAVALVGIPVAMLPGLAGRLFAPLGIAYVLAALTSLVVALTVTPALSIWLLQPRASSLPAITRALQWLYSKTLLFFSRQWWLLAIAVGLTLGVAIAALPRFQQKLLPELHEGHLIVHMVTLPGTSLEESLRIGNQATRLMHTLPFVTSVVQQVGRTEGGIDIWGSNISEFNVGLKSLSAAQESAAEHDLQAALDRVPGTHFEVSSFLTERVQEVISGYSADAVLNIYGEDLDALEMATTHIAQRLQSIQGVRQVQQPALPGLPEIAIDLDTAALNQAGLAPIDVLETIQNAYQGVIAAQLFEQNHTTDVAVLLDPNLRRSPSQIGQLRLKTPSGDFIAINALARIRQVDSRYLILHDGGRRVQTLTFNIDAKNSTNVLTAVRQLQSDTALPKGTYFELRSLAEQAQATRNQLLWRSLGAVIAIVALLSLIVSKARQILLILVNIPFALAGGAIALLATDQTLSLGALVGFLTVFGITLRNSVLMLAHYQHLVDREGCTWNLDTALLGARDRLLPILMTTVVTGAGLLPLALGSTEAGREIEGPMAWVILGGLASSTLLNLLALPLLALRFGAFEKTPDLA